MARNPTRNKKDGLIDLDADASSEDDPALKPMHTAEASEPSIEEGSVQFSATHVDAQGSAILPVDFKLPDDSLDLFRRALNNAATNHESETTMSEIATSAAPHSDPNPRRNSLVQNIHISNTQMRLEAENAILRATVAEIDRKIAELQAERTDATGAIAMNNAALNAGEKL